VDGYDDADDSESSGSYGLPLQAEPDDFAAPYGLSGESSENGDAVEYADETVVTPPPEWSALLSPASDLVFSGALIVSPL
jgi:hypothetical protein